MRSTWNNTVESRGARLSKAGWSEMPPARADTGGVTTGRGTKTAVRPFCVSVPVMAASRVTVTAEGKGCPHLEPSGSASSVLLQLRPQCIEAS